MRKTNGTVNLQNRHTAKSQGREYENGKQGKGSICFLLAVLSHSFLLHSFVAAAGKANLLASFPGAVSTGAAAAANETVGRLISESPGPRTSSQANIHHAN